MVCRLQFFVWQGRPDGATETPYGSNQVGSKRPLEQEDDQLGALCLATVQCALPISQCQRPGFLRTRAECNRVFSLRLLGASVFASIA